MRARCVAGVRRCFVVGRRRRAPAQAARRLRSDAVTAEQAPRRRSINLGNVRLSDRTGASREVRRGAGRRMAVPALIEAAAEHTRRLRPLPRARPAVRLQRSARRATSCVAALDEPNDRLRTVAYAYFEHNPERGMSPRLLDALDEGRRPSSSARR